MLDTLKNLKVYTFIRTAYMPDEAADSVKINLHWHNYYQLVYVRRGSGSVLLGDTSCPVREGDVVIIRRNEPHSFTTDGDRLETYELKFALLDEKADFLQEGPRYFTNDRDGAIKRSLKQIEQESDAMDPVSREIIALEVCKIFLLIRRGLAGQDGTAQAPQDDEDTDPLLAKINAYIDQNLHRNFTVRDMSNYLFMEYTYFSRMFSAKYGMRLKQYINQRRLVMAKELITGSNLTMTEIAVKCGFETLYRLERIFKAEEGISPSEFRNAFMNKYHVTFEKNPETYFQFEDAKGENNNGKHDQDNPCL